MPKKDKNVKDIKSLDKKSKVKDVSKNTEKEIKQEKSKKLKKKGSFKKILFLLLILILVGVIAFVGFKIYSNKSPEFEELTEIEYGIYIATPKEGETFVPMLTLNKDNTFEFKLSKVYKYNGQYSILHNKVVLTITEDKSYTFGKVGEELILVEDVEKYLTSGTSFRLWGTMEEIKDEPIKVENNVSNEQNTNTGQDTKNS